MSRDTKIMIVVVLFVTTALALALHRQITVANENTRLFRRNVTLRAEKQEAEDWADYWKTKAAFYRAKYDSVWATNQFRAN